MDHCVGADLAAHAGLRGGDVIVSINGERVKQHERAIEIIKKAQARVDRQDETGRLVLASSELELSYVPGETDLHTISLLDELPDDKAAAAVVKSPVRRTLEFATKLTSLKSY